jgi:endonuclease/exonuclease/phosphatase family metal-dependent hydrolase
VDGEEVHVINTHLSLFEWERQLQVAALLGPDWLGSSESQGPLVLAGDLNAIPGSLTLRRLRRRLRSVVEPTIDAPTLRTFSGRVPLYRLDHVLVSEQMKVRGVHVPRTSLSTVASDHLPLVVDLAISVSENQRRAAS